MNLQDMTRRDMLPTAQSRAGGIMLDIIEAIAANPSIRLPAPDAISSADWTPATERAVKTLLAHAGYLRKYGADAYHHSRSGGRTPAHGELAARVATCPLRLTEIARALDVTKTQLVAWLDVANGAKSPAGRVPIPAVVLQKASGLPVSDAPPRSSAPPTADPSIHEIVRSFRACRFSRTVFANAIGVNGSTFAAWLQLSDGKKVADTVRNRARPSKKHLACAAEIARKVAGQ